MSIQSARNPVALGLPPAAQSSQVKNLRDKDHNHKAGNEGALSQGILPGGGKP